jgi:hypothetical protein
MQQVRNLLSALTLPIRLSLLRRRVLFFDKYVGVDSAMRRPETVVTLNELMTPTVDPSTTLLKIDIERAEYELLADAQTRGVLAQIRVLIIEFHSTHRFRTQFLDVLKGLLASHTVVHVHGNSSIGRASDGLPKNLEVTLMKHPTAQIPHNHASQLEIREELPLPGVDFPNRKGEVQHELRFPPY